MHCKKVLILSVLFFFLFANQSCKKDQEETIISVTIGVNELFEYDLGYFGDEEGATIAIQALHYKVSEIGPYDTTVVWRKKYSYLPALDYVGKDEVTIKSFRGSDGSGSGPGSKNDELITKISFTIVRCQE